MLIKTCFISFHGKNLKVSVDFYGQFKNYIILSLQLMTCHMRVSDLRMKARTYRSVASFCTCRTKDSLKNINGEISSVS